MALDTSVFHMSRAVAQWLVPATDDRMVAGLNPSPVTHMTLCRAGVTVCRRFETWGVGQVRLPHIAYIRRGAYCVFRHNMLLVTSMVSMIDGGSCK